MQYKGIVFEYMSELVEWMNRYSQDGWIVIKVGVKGDNYYSVMEREREDKEDKM